MGDNIRTTSDHASFIIMGDFDDLDTGLLMQHTLLSQIVDKATWGSAVLDKILTDFGGSYHDPDVSAPISLSDNADVILLPHQLIQSVKPHKISFWPLRNFYPCFWAMDNAFGLVSIKGV